jgi:hypothetical protein
VTAWRSDVRDNYVLTLQAFLAANPTLLDRVHRSRPESLADTTCAFVGGISEAIGLDSGTWRRVADVEIAVTRHLSDNAETTDHLEELADALTDWLAADARAHVLGDHTEQHPIRTATIEIPESGIFIPAIAITCRATIQQGRS